MFCLFLLLMVCCNGYAAQGQKVQSKLVVIGQDGSSSKFIGMENYNRELLYSLQQFDTFNSIQDKVDLLASIIVARVCDGIQEKEGFADSAIIQLCWQFKTGQFFEMETSYRVEQHNRSFQDKEDENKRFLMILSQQEQEVLQKIPLIYRQLLIEKLDQYRKRTI